MAGETGSAEQVSGRLSALEADQPLNADQPAAASRQLYLVRAPESPHIQETVMQRSPPAPTGKSKGLLDRTVQALIGRMLRDIFADVADEEVPERFVKLLEALEAKEKHL